MKAYKPIAREADLSSVVRADVGADGAIIAVVDDRMDPGFTDTLTEALRSRLPQATIRLWPKPSGTSPAPEPLIREVAATAQAAVVGIGA